MNAAAWRDPANRAIAVALLAVVLVWGVNGAYLAPLSRVGYWAFWGADLAQWVLLPGVLLAWLHRRHGLRPADYGFDPHPPGWIALLLPTVLLTVVFHLCFFGFRDLVWRWLDYPGGFFQLADVFPDGIMGRVVWLYSALSAGLVESVFFIGLPWRLWSRLAPGTPVAFTLVVSLVFALVHWEQGPHVVAGALAFGLAACAGFFRWGSLWPVALGHVLVDLVDFS